MANCNEDSGSSAIEGHSSKSMGSSWYFVILSGLNRPRPEVHHHALFIHLDGVGVVGALLYVVCDTLRGRMRRRGKDLPVMLSALRFRSINNNNR